jgi:hypothetical protein
VDGALAAAEGYVRRISLQATIPHRREGFLETAARVSQWFSRLEKIDPALASWKPVGRKKPLAIDVESLAATLKRSAIVDDDGCPMPNTGYGLILASVDHASTALHFRVGLPEGPMDDNVLLQFAGDVRERSLDDVIRVVVATVEAWAPQWVAVSTDDWRAMYDAPPYPGWVTFVPIAVDLASAKLAKSVSIAGGTVVVLTHAPPDPQRGTDCMAADALAAEAIRGGFGFSPRTP